MKFLDRKEDGEKNIILISNNNKNKNIFFKIHFFFLNGRVKQRNE